MLRRISTSLALTVALMLAAVSAQAATVYIAEYANVGGSAVIWQAAKTPAVVEQIITTSGSSAQSAAFSSTTILIRLHTDGIVSCKIGGTNPTATTTNARFIAGQTEYFYVSAGDKVACINNT